jgi:hypothetical protein
VLYVPAASIEAYEPTDYWNRFASIQPIGDFSTGDVNYDGEQNISDVNVIIDAILAGKQKNRYDMNDDHEVNIADINVIINIILKTK